MDFRRKEVDGLPCLLVARMAGSGDRRTDYRRRGHNDGDPAGSRFAPRHVAKRPGAYTGHLGRVSKWTSDVLRGTDTVPRVGIGVHDEYVSDRCVYLLSRLLLWISACRQRHE
ncbi:unnamed protein product, partial [Ixodes persulcatus]